MANIGPGGPGESNRIIMMAESAPTTRQLLANSFIIGTVVINTQTDNLDKAQGKTHSRMFEVTFARDMITQQALANSSRKAQIMSYD
jgi:hypothetical protein